MTSTPPRMATALFTPDGDAHELLTIREPGWTPRTRYFRIERPGMTRQQCRSWALHLEDWAPSPDCDQSADAWEVEHLDVTWDDPTPGMVGTVATCWIEEDGADVVVTSPTGARVYRMNLSLIPDPGDPSGTQQIAHSLRQGGWQVDHDELREGDRVTWIGEPSHALVPRSTTDTPAVPVPPLDPEDEVFKDLPSPMGGTYPLPSSFTADLIPELKSWKRTAERHRAEEKGTATDMRTELAARWR